ncbi:hypothetical protein Mal52_48910 [Symmachiella dynata]|uniref:Uncharacterized protein n=1 Tax=Symmachiella dynata TaxID=2527995 RepID=A0A517ZV59_9PLAN|nr:hypothetical protein Mal52_48910 [Symmachiella dynata]
MKPCRIGKMETAVRESCLNESSADGEAEIIFDNVPSR